jgi:FkbM family methyltransferase
MKKHFFDVGANNGQTLPDYLAKTPEFDGWDVWCFEPSPRHLPHLMERLSRPEYATRYNLHLCPFGFRGKDGIIPFYTKDDPRGDSFESYLASDHETKNMRYGYDLHCPAYDAGDFIVNNTEKGDMVVLKLDCEGSEYELLSSLLGNPIALTRIDEILVEWHSINPAEPVFGEKTLTKAFDALGITLGRWML